MEEKSLRKCCQLLDTRGKDAFKDAYTQLKTAIKDETENLKAIRDDLQAIKDSYVDWDTESGKVMSENTVK